MGDKPFVALMWLCLFTTVIGYGLGHPQVANVAAPIGVATFLVWAWWAIRRRRQAGSFERAIEPPTND